MSKLLAPSGRPFRQMLGYPAAHFQQPRRHLTRPSRDPPRVWSRRARIGGVLAIFFLSRIGNMSKFSAESASGQETAQIRITSNTPAGAGSWADIVYAREHAET